MKALPPGRYAVVLADASGAPLGGQLAFILAWESAGSTWKLGGLTVRPSVLDGHDGLWWWTRARELARESQQGSEHSSADAGSAAKAGSANAAPHSFWSSWSAWYAYEAARLLLLPVDFLSSPNLEKLDAEQAQLGNSPRNAFPSVLPDGPRTWKIDAVHLDPTLLHADLGVVYESTGVTEARTGISSASTVSPPGRAVRRRFWPEAAARLGSSIFTAQVDAAAAWLVAFASTPATRPLLGPLKMKEPLQTQVSAKSRRQRSLNAGSASFR